MSTTLSALTGATLCLVRAAGAATARVGGGGRLMGVVALFHLEGVAAAARGGNVRVVDREARLETLDPVDLGAGEVGRAERVDDHGDAVALELAVAFLGATIEPKRVLEPRAATALNGDPQDRGLALGLLGHQIPDLRRRALGQRHEGQRSLGDLHAPIVAAWFGCPNPPLEVSGNAEFVTAASRLVEPFSSSLVASP